MSKEANHSEPSPDALEMLNDFNETAHHTFVTVLDHYTTDNIHPGLVGKPINLLRLSIERIHEPPIIDEWSPNPIAREALGLCVLRPANIDTLAKFTLHAQLPVEKKEQYKKLVIASDAIRLKEDLALSERLPHGVVWAGYNAARVQETALSVSTYEMPTNDEFGPTSGVAAALFYARDALAYVRSSHFHRPRGSERRMYRSGSEDDAALEGMAHELSFDMTPALGPHLNGSEPPAFLKAYQQKMAFEYERACNFLDKTRYEGGSEDAPAELVRQYEIALVQVNNLLAE